MMTNSLKCYYSGSENVVCHEHITNGKQRCKCHECGRSGRENPQLHGYTEAEGGIILRAYEERSSLRGLVKILGLEVIIYEHFKLGSLILLKNDFS